jgi:GTPase
MTEKKLHRIGRVDQIVRDYFENNQSVSEVMAKELMPLFLPSNVSGTGRCVLRSNACLNKPIAFIGTHGNRA